MTAVSGAEEMLLVLQDEIRRSEEARYDHRLHGVLLVAQGMSAPQVAQFLAGPFWCATWFSAILTAPRFRWIVLPWLYRDPLF